jgi:hypothetical protein
MTPGNSSGGGTEEKDLENARGSFFAWDDEYCAEHDGKIASFARLNERLDCIGDFEAVLKRDKINVVKTGRIVGGVILGAAVFAPVALLAAPGLAGALGATGLLGAAGTGTAIATLHGAALTSASLAAIGGGTMAGGVIFITAAGAALGARQGGVVSNSYFGEVEGFAIRKLQGGTGTGVIFVNGFLSEAEEGFQDWQDGVRAKWSRRPWYSVRWEASKLAKLGRMLAIDASGASMHAFAKKLSARAARKAASKFNPLTWAMLVAEMAGNPWHTAMVKASMTGILVADLLCRTAPREYTLMGHSLGARVIAYALQALSTRSGRPVVRDVYLLGGAIDRTDKAMWNNAAKAVSGTIHNCYSRNDKVLQYAYRGANAMLSDPIGIGPISGRNPKIRNWDFSNAVRSHMAWKSFLPKAMEHIARKSRHARKAARALIGFERRGTTARPVRPPGSKDDRSRNMTTT